MADYGDSISARYPRLVSALAGGMNQQGFQRPMPTMGSIGTGGPQAGAMPSYGGNPSSPRPSPFGSALPSITQPAPAPMAPTQSMPTWIGTPGPQYRSAQGIQQLLRANPYAGMAD